MLGLMAQVKLPYHGLGSTLGNRGRGWEVAQIRLGRVMTSLYYLQRHTEDNKLQTGWGESLLRSIAMEVSQSGSPGPSRVPWDHRQDSHGETAHDGHSCVSQ